MKNIKTQITLDILMIIVSIIMSILYLKLIISEEVMIGKKVITIIWATQVFIWSIKLWYDLNQKKIINK